MSKSTKHMQVRMSQRAIKSDLVQLTQQYGHRDGDKVVLTKKSLVMLQSELESLKKTVQEALKKGGVVVVETGDTMITTYRLDSYKRMAS